MKRINRLVISTAVSLLAGATAFTSLNGAPASGFPGVGSSPDAAAGTEHVKAAAPVGIVAENNIDDSQRYLAVPTGRNAEASAALETTDTLQEINEAELDRRQVVLNRINAHLDIDVRTLAALSKQVGELRDDVRADFEAAAEEAHAREKDLKRSLQEAEDATAENWEEVRAKLAVNFSSYAQAVAHAETVATTKSAITSAAE